MRITVLCATVCLSLILLVCGGCGSKSDGVDLKTSVENLKTQAGKMDAAQLKEMVVKYQTAIQSKQGEVDKLMKDLAGSKDEISDLMNSIKALEVRYDIYYDKLVELKADVTGLGL